MFVLDASMTLAWCFEDEDPALADRIARRLESDTALVPPVWSLEVVNALLTAERRRRIDVAGSDRFLAALSRLPIEVDAEDEPHAVLATARRRRLSSYDASYLVLARRRAVPLATLDDRLAAATRREGVPLVAEGEAP